MIPSERRHACSVNAPPPVLVALLRPPGYDDVHPELVVADALDHQTPWPHSLVRDDGSEVVVALERPDDYVDSFEQTAPPMAHDLTSLRAACGAPLVIKLAGDSQAMGKRLGAAS